MAAEGVLVFDDEPFTTALGGSEQSFVVVEGEHDVLVFDHSEVSGLGGRGVLEAPAPGTDFIIFDAQLNLTEEVVVSESNLLLVDRPQEPTRVVLDGDVTQDVVVLTAGGPPGPPGSPGPPGPPGTPGPGAYVQEFGFASPNTLWTIVHNQNSLALNVEVVDSNGDPLEGNVRFVDVNTIQIDWYYPTAGTARVFR